MARGGDGHPPLTLPRPARSPGRNNSGAASTQAREQDTRLPLPLAYVSNGSRAIGALLHLFLLFFFFKKKKEITVSIME